MHLINVADITARKKGREEVSVADVKRVYELFVDLNRSVQFLLDYQNEFMFNEIGPSESENSQAMEVSS